MKQSLIFRLVWCLDSGSCDDGQRCWEFGNPGFGHHGFDNIFMAWATIFIWMTQLYWWETASAIETTNYGISSSIAWHCGFLVVVMLAFLAVNMFVAVITATFAAARAQSAVKHVHDRLWPIFVHVRHSDRSVEHNLGNRDEWITTHAHGSLSIGELKELLESRFNLQRQNTKIYLGQLKEDDVYKDGNLKLVPHVDRRWGHPTRQMVDDEELAEVLLQEKNRRSLRHERMKVRKAAKRMYARAGPGQDLRGTPAEKEVDWANPPRALELRWRPPFYRIRWLHQAVVCPQFESIVMIVIITNTVFLTLEGADVSVDRQQMLNSAEIVFSIIFGVEMVLKILGMGLANYISSPLNFMDACIVVLSAATIVAEVMPGSSVARLIRVFKIARVSKVGRVARLFSMISSMKEVLVNVARSGRCICNIILIILFAITVQSIIGIHCFGNAFPQSFTSADIPRRSLQSIGRAWLLGFQTLTGDDWSNQMYRYMNVANPFGSFLFFALSFVVSNYILLNLFVAVILENFEMAEEEKIQQQAVKEKELWRSMLEHFILSGTLEVGRFGLLSEMAPNDGQHVLQSIRSPSLHHSRTVSEFEIFMEDQEEEKHKGWNFVSPIRRIIMWIMCDCGTCYTKRIRHSVRNLAQEVPVSQCQSDSSLCGIGENNNDSLCLFHGRVTERSVSIANDYGELEEKIVQEYLHPVRRIAEQVESNIWFERFVLLTILLSSAILAWQGPPGSKDDVLIFDAILAKDMLDISDTVFFTIFLFEMIVKVVAHGFMFTPDAYLMDGWNRLDFSVVVFSIVDRIADDLGNMGRILRIGRCLRPLRMINKNDGMKRVITAALESIGTNIGVMVLAATMYIFFSVIGVQLFGGKFKYCTCPWAVGPAVWIEGTTMVTTEGETVPGMNDRILCLSSSTVTTGGHQFFNSTLSHVNNVPQNLESYTTVPCEWLNRPYRFDDFTSAMETLFTASTLAGWTDIMEACLDATVVDQQPQDFANPGAVLYWLGFVFLMGITFTNLFVGVLINYMSKSDGTALMTQEQLEWTDLHATTNQFRPTFRVLIPSSSLMRRLALRFVRDPTWDKLSASALIGNIFVMMAEFDGSPSWYQVKGVALERFYSPHSCHLQSQIALILLLANDELVFAGRARTNEHGLLMVFYC